MKKFVCLVLLSTAALTGSASAAVIAGPALPFAEGAWQYSGVQFVANRNTSLTGFTFNSQGNADTLLLTDLSGNVLHSLAVSAGEATKNLSVAWLLGSGVEYRLLRTTASNSMFATYGQALPSNEDISMTVTGVFSSGITGSSFEPNRFWSTFTSITTAAASDVPEPAMLGLLGLGVLGIAAGRRRKIA